MAAGDTVLGEASVVIRAELDQYTKDLAGARAQTEDFANKGQAAVDKHSKSQEQLNSKVRESTDLFRKLKEVAVALGLVLGAERLIQLTDTWEKLNTQLKVHLGSETAAQAAMKDLQTTANLTHTSLETVVSTFNRQNAALTGLGYSTKQQLDITKSMNLGFLASGTSGDEAQRAVRALTLAIDQNRLGGYALNSIMYQGSVIADLLAQKFNTNVTSLRVLANEGKITGKVIADVLLANLDKLGKQAADMPLRVDQAMVDLKNAVLGFVGRLDQATGGSRALAKAIEGLANFITNNLLPAALTVAKGLGAIADAAERGIKAFTDLLPVSSHAVDVLKAFAVGGAILVGMLELVKAVQAIAAGLQGMIANLLPHFALLLSPFIALPLALVAAAGAALIFRNEIKQYIGVDVVDTFKTMAQNVVAAFVVMEVGIEFAFRNLGDILTNWFGQLQTKLLGPDSPLGRLIKIGAALSQGNWIGALGEIGSAGLNLGFGAIGFDPFPTAGAADPQSKALADAFQKMLDQRLASTKNFLNKIGLGPSAAGAPGETSPGDKPPPGGQLNAQFDKLIKDGQIFIDQQQQLVKTIGVSEKVADEMNQQFKLINDAEKANIVLTPEMRDQLMSLGKAMGDAEYHAKKAAEQFAFAKDEFKGFFDDMKSGLEQGKGLWKSFESAALNALNKIIDKLETDVINAIFDVNNAMAGGGTGGLLGSFVKLFGGLFGGGGGIGPSVGAMASATTGAGLYATGGIVGTTSVPNISVPTAAFMGAPRFEFGSNAVPAILHKGERVIPAGQAMGGGAVPLSLNIHNNGPPINLRQQGEPQFDGRQMIINLVLDALATGRVDAGMRRFGNQPLPVKRG